MNKLKETIETLANEFKSDLTKEVQKDQRAASPIAFWLSKEYKDKFDSLQSISGQKFGKVVQEVIKKTIDSVEEK